MCVRIYVCPSISLQPFNRSTSHLAGAVLSVKLFGRAILKTAANSHTGGHAMALFGARHMTSNEER